MVRIVIDDEQARIVDQSLEPIEICDKSGTVLGYIAPTWTAEDIALARKSLASSEPRHTTEEVLKHLALAPGSSD